MVQRPNLQISMGKPVTSYTGSEPHRERGMMDKIKEKLPGTHDPYSSNSHATGTTATYGGTGHTGSDQHHGMMEQDY
ncbi:cold-shock protein CS120-like [Prunus yedoensis var. nudiflora]|uniref:Cold-shock protein CS120-like n=1 Tax=Prunus yedoensis var. nudiflora TaxID=2094558 RepID=A0A314XYB1_PRUYE|nr:cold-shock protein CS120-like [Prunus yedoensis var. nudiflora]